MNAQILSSRPGKGPAFSRKSESDAVSTGKGLSAVWPVAGSKPLGCGCVPMGTAGGVVQKGCQWYWSLVVIASMSGAIHASML